MYKTQKFTTPLNIKVLSITCYEAQKLENQILLHLEALNSVPLTLHQALNLIRSK